VSISDTITPKAIATGGNALLNISSMPILDGSVVLVSSNRRMMGGIPAPRQRKGKGHNLFICIDTWGALDRFMSCGSVLSALDMNASHS